MLRVSHYEIHFWRYDATKIDGNSLGTLYKRCFCKFHHQLSTLNLKISLTNITIQENIKHCKSDSVLTNSLVYFPPLSWSTTLSKKLRTKISRILLSFLIAFKLWLLAVPLLRLSHSSIQPYTIMILCDSSSLSVLQLL